MARRRNRVLIEFTTNTSNAAGERVRTEGDRVQVDPMSAKSFVKQGVARVVSDEDVVGEPADGEQGPSGEVTNTVTGATSTGVVTGSSIDTDDSDDDESSGFGGR